MRRINILSITGVETGLDMYLTTPPVDLVSVRANGHRLETVHMRDGVGVRVRDIFNQMQAKVESVPSTRPWTLKLFILQGTLPTASDSDSAEH